MDIATGVRPPIPAAPGKTYDWWRASCFGLNHRKCARRRPARKCFINPQRIGGAKLEIARLRIVDNMFKRRCLRNGEKARISQQKTQRCLAGGGAMPVR